jgi:hypothetical protein
MHRVFYPGLITLFLASALVSSACGSSSSTSGSAGSGPGSGGTGGGGATSSGGATSGTGTYTGSGGAPTVTVSCQGHIYQCGDLMDNDGDGKVDSQDPDCLGPCDNTEDSYFGGIPGQEGDPCRVDCYFDQDSGQGNDQCYWSHWCDPNEADPTYYPEPVNGAQCAYDESKPVPTAGPPGTCDELYTEQSQTCIAFCGPLTPNGCDCFGCCELPAGGGKYVWLGSTGADGTSVCSLDVVDDPDKCHPCLPVAACLNGCDKCELCLGKDELPPECMPGEGGAGGGGTGQCAEGIQPCGLAGQSPCPDQYYCITGCCQLYDEPR